MRVIVLSLAVDRIRSKLISIVGVIYAIKFSYQLETMAVILYIPTYTQKVIRYNLMGVVREWLQK